MFHHTDNKYIHSITNENFEAIALQLFDYQYANNILYKSFVDTLGRNDKRPKSLQEIPFLPISFFKTHKVVTGDFDTGLVFESSTTTSETPSKHYVKNEQLYFESLLNGFTSFYGSPSNYAILALLPSYLQRGNASLVHMTKVLMEHSGHESNGFYIDEFDRLHNVLLELENAQHPVLLIGVTFALLDFAERYPIQLNNTIVMETGGMKGRRKEMVRDEVHDYLSSKFSVQSIHSEYGMTELLSQAYSKGEGVFSPSSTMKLLVRDINDPLDLNTHGTGCLNIIDLANVDSCAFIATDDIGRIFPNETFEVLGRADNSALRGCNLMAV
ncbi:MAG: acyl transferase [Chitinophagales bacterium]|nr:acyl transferase [Chitinophagales bacterium]